MMLRQGAHEFDVPRRTQCHFAIGSDLIRIMWLTLLQIWIERKRGRVTVRRLADRGPSIAKSLGTT